MQARIEAFDIHKTVCFDEADRAQVYGNIIALMKEAQVALPGTSDEETLRIFNQYVRQEAVQALSESLGYGVSYSTLLLVMLAAFWPLAFDRVGGMILDRVSVREQILYVVYFGNSVHNVFPCTVCVVMLLGRRLMHMRGVLEFIYILVITIIGIFYGIACDLSNHNYIMPKAVESDLFLAVEFCYCGLHTAITLGLFRPRVADIRRVRPF